MKSKLNVVGSGTPSATRPSPFDDMVTLRQQNQTTFEALAQKEPAPRPPREGSAQKQKLWAPIYLDELTILQLPPAARLLCVLRYRSFRERSVNVKSSCLRPTLRRKQVLKPVGALAMQESWKSSVSCRSRAMDDKL